MTTNMNTHTALNFETSMWMPAPRERVWGALTDPQQLAQWFLPPALGAQLELDGDGKLSVMMGPMGVKVAVFDALDAPRQITSRSLPDQLLTTTTTLERASPPV